MTQQSNQLSRKKESGFYNNLREMTGKVVGRYVARGVIPRREHEDVETAIIEKFLLKQNKIDSSFQGKAKLSTYYLAVINRMCAEVIRKEQNHWYAVNDMNDSGIFYDSTLSFETAKQTLLQEELKRFNACLLLFNSLQGKLILFLKYQYNIPVNTTDVEKYAGDKSREAMKILEGRNDLSKAMVNERLARLVALVEGKQLTGDAVRMWLNKQTDILLARLNGRGKRFHNKETIGVMLEMQISNGNNDFNAR